MSASEQSSPSTKPAEPSPWNEGDISFRKGNCNVLLIAPHGHPKNDEKTYDITRIAADQLDCYSIVTNTYRKPFKRNGSNKRPLPDKARKWVNLNRKDQVLEHLESEFEKPLRNIVDEIIETAGKALVIWIHGIGDGNLPSAKPETQDVDVNAVIGIGQGTPDRISAYRKTVNRMISVMETNPHNPLKAVLAKKGSNYCGWHNNIMNQYFRTEGYSLQKVESIQIEIGKKGFRQDDNYQSTAMALANSLIGIARRLDTKNEETALDSAVQNGGIQRIPLADIDMDNGQFMSRFDDIASDTVDFKRLVDSINRHGVLNPVIVRRRSDTEGKPYQLISGFRRLTALTAAITEKDADEATVSARVLDDSVTDDEAYQISFTENLARQDLSLWEIAKACAKIRDQKIAESGMSKGQIEKHLAEMIQKDARTVRRYLKLSSTENRDIIEAVHAGNITPTTALDIGNKDLDEGEIAAILLHIKKFPKTTRSFVQFYSNFEMCSKLSKLSVSEVLTCPNADKFLSLDQKELIARLQHRQKTSGLSKAEILKGQAGSLDKPLSAMESESFNKDFKDRFTEAAAPISQDVAKLFKDSEIKAQFKIEPRQKGEVKVTISAPADEIHKVINLAASKITHNDAKNLAAQMNSKLKKQR